MPRFSKSSTSRGSRPSGNGSTRASRGGTTSQRSKRVRQRGSDCSARTSSPMSFDPRARRAPPCFGSANRWPPLAVRQRLGSSPAPAQGSRRAQDREQPLVQLLVLRHRAVSVEDQLDLLARLRLARAADLDHEHPPGQVGELDRDLVVPGRVAARRERARGAQEAQRVEHAVQFLGFLRALAARPEPALAAQVAQVLAQALDRQRDLLVLGDRAQLGAPEAVDRAHDAVVERLRHEGAGVLAAALEEPAVLAALVLGRLAEPAALRQAADADPDRGRVGRLGHGLADAELGELDLLELAEQVVDLGRVRLQRLVQPVLARALQRDLPELAQRAEVQAAGTALQPDRGHVLAARAQEVRVDHVLEREADQPHAVLLERPGEAESLAQPVPDLALGVAGAPQAQRVLGPVAQLELEAQLRRLEAERVERSAELVDETGVVQRAQALQPGRDEVRVELQALGPGRLRAPALLAARQIQRHVGGLVRALALQLSRAAHAHDLAGDELQREIGLEVVELPVGGRVQVAAHAHEAPAHAHVDALVVGVQAADLDALVVALAVDELLDLDHDARRLEAQRARVALALGQGAAVRGQRDRQQVLDAAGIGRHRARVDEAPAPALVALDADAPVARDVLDDQRAHAREIEALEELLLLDLDLAHVVAHAEVQARAGQADDAGQQELAAPLHRRLRQAVHRPSSSETSGGTQTTHRCVRETRAGSCRSSRRSWRSRWRTLTRHSRAAAQLNALTNRSRSASNCVLTIEPAAPKAKTRASARPSSEALSGVPAFFCGGKRIAAPSTNGPRRSVACCCQSPTLAPSSGRSSHEPSAERTTCSTVEPGSPLPTESACAPTILTRRPLRRSSSVIGCWYRPAASTHCVPQALVPNCGCPVTSSCPRLTIPRGAISSPQGESSVASEFSAGSGSGALAQTSRPPRST